MRKIIVLLLFSLCIISCAKEETPPLAWLTGKWAFKEVLDFSTNGVPTNRRITNRTLEISLDSRMIVTDSLNQKDTLTYLCDEIAEKIYLLYEVDPLSYYPTVYNIIERNDDSQLWTRTDTYRYLNSQLDTVTVDTYIQWYLTRL